MATPMVGPAGCVRLPDGRSLDFSSVGPEEGYPVVYCHGAIGSPRWHTPDLHQVTERLSIRYLVVNRPGFAGSDPNPGRTVADFADDIGELMSILGYQRFSVVGVSAGAPYALACGWAMPDRVRRLAAVSPLGPPDGLGASRGLRYQLPLVPFGSPTIGPPLAHASLSLLRLRRRTSPLAMIEDYRACRSNWGFAPGDLRIPVTIWHGRCDRLVPLAHTLALAEAIPNCTAQIDPDGGHFFYSRRLVEIIGSLLPDALAATLPDAAAAPLPDAAAATPPDQIALPEAA